MNRDVEQPALPMLDYRRQTRYRLRLEFAVPDDAQPPRALGHQHAAIRQKGKPPRMLQSRHDRDEPECVLVGLYRVHGLRARQQRRAQAGQKAVRTEVQRLILKLMIAQCCQKSVLLDNRLFPVYGFP
jgi:hypothetical protein